MSKLIIFDLDGVLLDAKIIHYESLNKALAEFDSRYIITYEEHLRIFDGISTRKKLDLLTQTRYLPISLHEQIWRFKQTYTLNALQSLTEDKKLIVILQQLKLQNYKIACCSNSIKDTIVTALGRKKVLEYFDLIVSNEDIDNLKPHPAIFWKTMIEFNCFPEDCIIVEDSPVGLLAANRSNAKVLRVKDPEDLTLKKITEFLNITRMYTESVTWTDPNLNIVIPMAGAGSRFEKAGFTFPKPLIDVKGKPMIQTVVQNIAMEGNYIFIVQKSHRSKYNLDTLLNVLSPKCSIVETDGLTEGATCTVLLAENLIDNEHPLIIANSDQYVEWSSVEFMYKMQEQNVDAGLLTFESLHPKWSYAKLDEKGYVVEVAEKNPISNIASVGIYYWKKGSDFVKYAKRMIENNTRVNNEFYVCPVFNEAILDGKKIKTYNIEKMWGLGTPEDLNTYLTK